MSAGTHLLIADLSQAATIAPIAQTAVHPTVAALPTAAAHRIAVVAVVVVPLAAAALVAAAVEAVQEVAAVAT
jgi:hypothetical protein